MFLTFTIPIDSQSKVVDEIKLERCIHKVGKGDKQALAQLYKDTQVALYGYILSFTKNKSDAEDILQNTYLKVYSSAPNYRAQGKPMAWLFTIAKNFCLILFRSRKKQVDAAEDTWQAVYTAEPSLDIADQLTLNTAINQLADEERQIVMLHAVSGFKHREIADFLEKPLATILSKYRRALSKLRNVLEENHA